MIVPRCEDESPPHRYPYHGILRSFVYSGAVLLGSLLLFAVQPMLAKAILPWFGGSSEVWIVCALFFQSALVAGYAYAHAVVRLLPPRGQAALHLGLLALSLLVLPVLPQAAWKPAGAEHPAFRILLLLGATVGLPYTLLAATTPLVQAWYARSNRRPPYRLFALSNLASLAALLSYPFLIEPLAGVRRQAWIWSAAYVLFAALCGAAAVTGARGAALKRPPAGAAPVSASTRALWFVLPAVASMLSLAVTTHLTQNVAPVPFLWIVPLAAYLLSFIVAFESDRWYRRAVWLPLLALALPAMSWLLLTRLPGQDLRLQLVLFTGGLFVACMFCHGEVARLRPDPSRLTSYYLTLAGGGAAGAVVVALGAPLLLRTYAELPLAILLCGGLALLLTRRRPTSLPRPVWAALLPAMAIGIGIAANEPPPGTREMDRNFYGGLRVADATPEGLNGGVRRLYHGAIIHGCQWLRPDRRRLPTTYFGPDSGIGLLLRDPPPAPRRVGVVGLGAGTIAAYERPGDLYRFYELNPLVAELARREFTFLGDAPGVTGVVLGDGRLSLEREPPQRFDVLAIDAFSGDAIPAHLLSREALELYFRHLKPGGVLAMHLTNLNLDLPPVVAAAAAALGKDTREIDSPGDPARQVLAARWVLVSDDFRSASPPIAAAPPARLKPGLRLWTDDYSGLWEVLK